LHDGDLRDRSGDRRPVLRLPGAVDPAPLGSGREVAPAMREVGMQVTAKAEYALRAVTVLASSGPGPVKSEAIAAAEGIPLRFLHNILAALTRGGILSSLRGADGGYELCRDAATITVADVIRAVEG